MKAIVQRISVLYALWVLCQAASALPPKTEVHAPDWYDLQSRNLHYPKETWFTGFATDAPQAGESVAQATERIKRDAQTDAASSIRMKVEKTLSSASRSELTEGPGMFDERVTEIFESATRMEVKMEIPGLRTETWQNPATGEIAAFACIKKDDLVKKLDRQLTAGITKLEMSIEHIQTLMEAGNKTEARKEAEATAAQFAGIEQTQALLSATGSDPEDLQLTETAALRRTLSNLQAELQHGISICLRMEATWKEEPWSVPEQRIRGELSALGCNFTTDSIATDWVIDVVATPRNYLCNTFGNINTYTSYVDTRISIFQTHTAKRIYEDVLTTKGTHTISFDEAVRAAYEESIRQTSETIKQQITQ